ncbi:MAG TPA: aminodeoxychorismate lyase [Jatrophihabitans sp.]|nr:aminodeoxychorismate lyase [Jatrophihabitans sp.]
MTISGEQGVVAVLGLGPVPPGTPVLAADDLGLTRGDGCFEATRVVTDDRGRHRIDHLDAHLDRFDHSCAGLDLPPIDRSAWQQLIADALAQWRLPGEAMLRLMLTRGRESSPAGPVTGVLTLLPLAAETRRQRDGIDLVTLDRGLPSSGYQQARWLLGGVKTLSYAVNVAALREARRRGAQDVLFVSSDGFVLEAPTSTAVWLSGGSLHTPPVDGAGVLASITQQALFQAASRAGWATSYSRATVPELHAADGLWLVSSGRGVAPVRTLDGTAVEGKPDVTEQLRELAGF